MDEMKLIPEFGSEWTVNGMGKPLMGPKFKTNQ